MGRKDYTTACFGSANVLSLLVSAVDGTLQQRSDILLSDASHWIDGPAQLAMTEAGGKHYVVIAGTGSGSLSVLEAQSGTMLIMRDHLLDSRDTRFAHAAVLETLSLGEHSLVVAGGSDDGFSVFAGRAIAPVVHSGRQPSHAVAWGDGAAGAGE